MRETHNAAAYPLCAVQLKCSVQLARNVVDVGLHCFNTLDRQTDVDSKKAP